MSKRNKQADELKAAIAGLEAQRSLLGDTVVEPALAALRQQLSRLEPSPVDAASDEERKIVTVLFVDVSGFTALSEKLDSEEVRGRSIPASNTLCQLSKNTRARSSHRCEALRRTASAAEWALLHDRAVEFLHGNLVKPAPRF